jgi:hypothetical protein
MKMKFLTLVLALGAQSALAEVEAPSVISQQYQSLRAVELNPSRAPRLQAGPDAIASREARFSERLPMQLSGAISKVKAAKYRPGKRARTIRF